MTALRWTLGGLAGSFTLVWIGFFLFADRFRRSWGASPNPQWTLYLPIAVAVLLLLSVLLPSSRILLHATALSVLAVSIGALSILRPAPFLATCWLIYAGLWLAYYLQVLRSAAV